MHLLEKYEIHFSHLAYIYRKFANKSATEWYPLFFNLQEVISSYFVHSSPRRSPATP